MANNNKRNISAQLTEEQMKDLLLIERAMGAKHGDRSEIIRHALQLKIEYEKNKIYEEATE